jgi:hypothetical protein
VDPDPPRRRPRAAARSRLSSQRPLASDPSADSLANVATAAVKAVLASVRKRVCSGGSR